MRMSWKIYLKLFIMIVMFSSIMYAQEESEQLSSRALKWFPEGNYTNITSLDLSISKDEPEFTLLKMYWQVYPDSDPFDNFLPSPLDDFRYKAYGKAARFKVRKPTEKGKKKLEKNYGNGGDLREFGGENYFIRNEGFEIIVCVYDDPAILIAEALKNKQIAKEYESSFGINIYVTTPTGAKLQVQRYFCPTGSGEILIAPSPQVLETMLDAGFGAGNLAETKEGSFILEFSESLGMYWMYDNFEASTKVQLDLAKKAGDEARIKQYQGYLDQANNQIFRYFSLKKNKLRYGNFNIYPTEARAQEVYQKYKEYEGIDRASLSSQARMKNFYLTHPDVKNELKGNVQIKYRDITREELLKRIEEAKELKKEAEGRKKNN